ncbi:hypothetical protein Ade02nite_46760 [Paractinoplanes deccanensis]|uniref:Uncharacterized protein n=1 Tax=Paractinoplanes deccanensis TaxID=113561 RepID=A0ABQ3Y846_9ACTN|nr:hypothetical protein [Actinoplanes deccanensis]GID76035.1 hypothetical protein Ade02nite_46760 [Actinoplanes deccanensis]
MNKVMRKITMTGVALAAGLTMAAAPAAALAAPAQGGSATQAGDHKGPRGDRLVGFYRTQSQCWKVGRIGQFHDRWDRFDCDRVYRGFKRGWVALKVSNDFRGHGHTHGHGPNRPHGHR